MKRKASEIEGKLTSSSIVRATANSIPEVECQQSPAAAQQDQTTATAVNDPDAEETFRTLYDGFACKFPSQSFPQQGTNQSQTTLPRTKRASASIAAHTSSVATSRS